MSLSTLQSVFQGQLSNGGLISITTATFTQAGLTVPARLDQLIASGYSLGSGVTLTLSVPSGSIPAPTPTALNFAAQGTYLGISNAVFNLSFTTGPGSSALSF